MGRGLEGGGGAAADVSGAWQRPGPGSAIGVAELAAGAGDRKARDLVEGVLAGRRLEAWAAWCQLSVIAELLRRWTDQPPTDTDLDDIADTDTGTDADVEDAGEEDADADGTVRGDGDAGIAGRCARVVESAQRRARAVIPTPAELVPDFVSAEVSLIGGLTRSAADARVLAAQVLLVDAVLPRTCRLLRAGLLDWPKVQLLVQRLGVGMSSGLAALAEAEVISDADLALADRLEGSDPDRPESGLPEVTRCTGPALDRAVEAAISRVDAREAARRRERAQARRRVSTWTDRDAMGRLEARTGQEQIAAMWNALSAAAHAAKKTGDTRTIDQLRLDEMIHRVTGVDLRPDRTDRTTQDPAPAQSGSSASGSPGSGSGVLAPPWAVSLTLPLSTFLALADDPGVLDGYGPIAGAVVRRSAVYAADAARGDPRRTTWRCVVTDDVHGSVLGVGQAFTTPHHDPPDRLVDLVRAARPRCVFPGCPIPARRCDLDHRVPYQPDDPGSGGSTCECNLQPLCRSHHRLKTTGLITVRPAAPHGGQPEPAPQHGAERGDEPGDEPGAEPDLEWTSRAGLRYRTLRQPATPPPVPAAWQPLLAELDRQRRVGDDLLAWVNRALRGAYTRGRREATTALLADVEAELDSEIRHHDYGELVARNDPDNLNDPDLPPEPPHPLPAEPAWMRAVHWTTPDDADRPEDDDECPPVLVGRP